jgi:hypothetical protein
MSQPPKASGARPAAPVASEERAHWPTDEPQFAPESGTERPPEDLKGGSQVEGEPRRDVGTSGATGSKGGKYNELD